MYYVSNSKTAKNPAFPQHPTSAIPKNVLKYMYI